MVQPRANSPTNKRDLIGVSLATLFLLLPLLLSGLILGEDQGAFLRWCLAFTLPGLAFLPLARRLFLDRPDGSWLYSVFLGFLLPALLIWALAHAGLPLFSQVPILIVLLASAVLLFFLHPRAQNPRLSWPKPPLPTLTVALAETGLLFSLFLFWSFLRSLKPEIYGLEKFMDYGFMMSMWRSDLLPAKDMWLAGHSINYYYFGQYLFTYLAKLTGVTPAVSYNLSIAASFALTFGLAFALIRDVLSQRRQGRAIPTVAGLAGASLLTLAGNSHAFFYGNDKPGNFLVRFLERSGVTTGQLGNFYFSDSTRFIGYNPETSDRTIHEFPSYSYLVADLHAHMINLTVVLLLLAVLFQLVSYLRLRPKPPTPNHSLEKGELAEYGYLVYLGLLLGVSAMANYWDFVIYFVVCFVTLVIVYMARYESTGSVLDFLLMLVQLGLVFVPFLLIKEPLLQLFLFFVAAVLAWQLDRFRKSAWTRAGLGAAILFFTAHLVSLSFSLNFDPMAKSFALAENHSGFYRLFILWFAHVGIGLLFLVTFISHNYKNKLLRKSDKQNLLVRLCSLEPAEVYTAILILCGVGLIIAPELLYVRDIYEGSFSRANTMFKFTYQAFALLSLAAGIGLGVLTQRLVPMRIAEETSPPNPDSKDTTDALSMPKRYRGKRSEGPTGEWKIGAIFPLALALLLFAIPFYYTGEIRSWYGEPSLDRSQGLTGDRYLGTLYVQAEDGEYYSLSHRLALIDWFNEEVEGQPVILEAYGDSYSDYNSVSAYTGLPTVLGWQTHEWLWRTSEKVTNAYGEIVAPLQDEIRDFYEARSPQTMIAFLQKYQIHYIVVGELERTKFIEIDEATLQTLGEIIFQSDSDYILRVYPFAEG